MTATLHNIGTPRAFGHAVALGGYPYINPYPANSKPYSQWTTGYFEGDDARYHSNVIIPPDEPPLRDDYLG